MSKTARKVMILVVLLTLIIPASVFGQESQVVQATLLHTNDFHGRLQPDTSNRGGSAFMAGVVEGIRSAVGPENVLLLDGGDVFFAAPAISQLLMGESTIDIYNRMGYDLSVFGNHEFDKGQDLLAQRVAQSEFPWLGANVVLEGTEWDLPSWAQPYTLLTVGTPPNQATIGVLGLAGQETPEVTLLGTTSGLVFKDLTATILHYYDEILAQADALVVVAHMGTTNSGPYKGLVTVAQELIAAGSPVDLMIGGHQHESLYTPLKIDNRTVIAAAGHSGRWLGRLDVSIDKTAKRLTVDTANLVTITTDLAPDPAIAERVAYWADVVAPVVNQTVGYTNISLVRDYNNESVLGDIVSDAMLWKADLYDDGVMNQSVAAAFTNPGGLRADIPIPAGAALPYTITWGATFDVLPFGNTLFLMDLTGAQIQALLDQSATLYKGILQSSGVEHYYYNDTGTLAPTAYGAYGITIGGAPLVRSKVYRVVTNDFLAGGQDGWTTFAKGTNRWNTYYDMQQAFAEYVGMLGTLDQEDIPMGRVTRLDNVVTILHTNDTHGNWAPTLSSGNPNGMAYVASLIKAERARNPNALLLEAGDTFQGNSFAYFFKDRPDNPISGGLNLLGYDAMVVGNHEFNFGPATFATMLGQLDFPLLGSLNLVDDGGYGFVNDNLKDYINLNVGDVKVTIFGLTNPRVYRYELPTNIPGLTFLSALDEAAAFVPGLIASEDPDLLVGLTHIGYAPYADEIDSDTLLAETVAGIDVLVGAHSHTRVNPSIIVSSAVNPDGTLVAQAERYALHLGKINVGFIGGEMVLREGYLIPAREAAVDPELNAYLAPYFAEIDAYNATVIGQTQVPLVAVPAYTEETNGANMQADAAVWGLTAQGIPVDFHLSGAMANRNVATAANPDNPLVLTKGDMFNLMPYENSLVVLSMNGPQIKTVLERAYRNYYYYKYVPGRGGYSYYTTCMLDTNSSGQIVYKDTHPQLPDGDNVKALYVNGAAVDFSDASKYYLVSTVNYLAAGSCNFNNAGETIWPLDQIAYDTQYYVRDNVIDYVEAQAGPVAPLVEGRLIFEKPGLTYDGCTRGLGWWKNNAGGKPKTPDLVTQLLPVWLGLNPGYSSINVNSAELARQYFNLNGDPSNGTNKLYAQFLTAKLNLARSTNPSSIAGPLIGADNFLTWFGARHWSMLTMEQQKSVAYWMDLFDKYNNGLLGPAVCK